MRFTTKTEYGLVCLVYMAKRLKDQMVTIGDIVKQEKMPVPYLQKIFITLRDANIVVAHHGRSGGYSLARHPSQINLKEIIDALEGGTFEVFCEPDLRSNIVCTHFSLCNLTSVWWNTKDILDNYYRTVTLEMIANGGLTKPVSAYAHSAKEEKP